MPTPPRQARRRHASRPAFSLVEVMVAVAIFALGMTAVASIFPVAILLQRQTVDEIRARHFVENTAAEIEGRRLIGTIAEWTPVDHTPANTLTYEVMPLADAPAIMNQWTLDDRSYPSHDAITNRRLFWVPLVYDSQPGTITATSDFEPTIFAFIVRGREDATFDRSSGTHANPASDPDYIPSVSQISATVSADGRRFDFSNGGSLLRKGEKFIDGLGNPAYEVVDADSGGVTIAGATDPSLFGQTVNIWHAAPSSSGSSFVNLVSIGNLEFFDVLP